VLLGELLTVDCVRVPLGSNSKDDILRELVELAARSESGDVVEPMLAAVREREHEISTATGGVALPHGRTPVIDHLLMAAGVTPRPVDFGALDGRPVELFFLLVGPESAASTHVRALSRISRLLRQARLRQALCQAPDEKTFVRLVQASEAH
jgi:mannitol/fructose-specific phosphotransferase system IIA component (Ntr-type)